MERQIRASAEKRFCQRLHTAYELT
jgi:hypothetical protein